MANTSEPTLLDKRSSTKSNDYKPVHFNAAFSAADDKEQEHENLKAHLENNLDQKTNVGYDGSANPPKVEHFYDTASTGRVYDTVARDDPTIHGETAFHGFTGRGPFERTNHAPPQQISLTKNKLDLHGGNAKEAGLICAKRRCLCVCVLVVCLALAAIAGFLTYLFVFKNNATSEYESSLGSMTTSPGYISQASTTVTTATIMNCENIIVKTSSEFGAVVTWIEPVISDADGTTFDLTDRTYTPGTFFPIGATPVAYHFRDVLGNTETCEFEVIVTFDDTNPCTANPCGLGTCVPSNSQDMYVCQCPRLYYYAHRTCQYDATPPQITCPADVETSTSGSAAIVDWVEPIAADNSGIPPMQTYQSHQPGGFFTIGRTGVQYTFQDRAGNTAICSFTVTVSAVITTPTDPCQPNQCQNGAFCYSSNGEDFLCICFNGYSGTLCEVWSPCQPNPCHNSGTCYPSSDGFTCTCTSSWSGNICNIPMPCQPNPCQNGGTCTQIDALTYACFCVTGWIGGHCEAKIIPVWEPWTSWTACSVSCGSGWQQRTRTCLDLDPVDTATCIGSSLENTPCTLPVCEEPSPCQSSPCRNGGTCILIGYAAYTCYCATGYIGSQCESIIYPEWSPWNPWTTCSVSCDIGIQYRFRTCSDLITTDSITCLGPATASQQCTETPCPTADPVKPDWSTWTSWSQCSVTCNTGTRQRSRTCQDDFPSDGLICAGQGIETQPCATWDCPDCNKMCPFGTLNTNSCDVCECSGHFLTGRVLDLNNRPLSDASIAYNYRPNTTLAKTNSEGRFSVNGVCAVVQTMVVTKEKYSTAVIETQVVTVLSSSLQATLHRLEVPVITDHPRTKTRLTGESVSFCCSAQSEPLPTRYEWYKDGDILSTTGTTLTLHQLSIDNSGSYKCRVMGDGGNVFSDPAILTVTASPVQCNSQPAEQLIDLPPDCVQADTGFAAYNVGTCDNAVCTGTKAQQTLCKDPDEETHCCQAIQTQTVNVICQGYTLPMSKILACGCGVCVINPTQVGGVVVSAGTGEPLDFIFVYYDDEVVASTDEKGWFSFEIPLQVNRVSLSFSDEIKNRVSGTTVIIEIQSHSVTYNIIKMKPRPPEVTVQPTQENCLTVLGTDTDPLAEVVIPPNSIYDANGQRYTGNAKATISTIDMRNSTDAELAPGDFTAVNANGDRETLKSFGMFSIDITDDSGNPLSVGGKVNLMVDVGMVPGCDNPDGVCSTKIWVLNKKTGSWEDLGPLVVSTGGRRRKRQSGENIILAGKTFEFEPGQYINIDDINVAEQCWVKVIGYENSALSQILPNSVSKFEVTAIVKDSQQNFYQRNNNANWATTRYGEGVCVPIPCDTGTGGIGSRRYTVYLSASSDGKDMLPADSTSSGFVLTDADKLSLGYRITEHFYIEMQPQIAQNQNQGPIFTGTNAGKFSNGACSTATSLTKHFQFHRELPDIFCYNFFQPNQRLNYILNFYPQTNHKVITIQKQQRFCYIGINIITPFDQSVTVVSTSIVGDAKGYTIPAGDPQYYGRRQKNAKKKNPSDSSIDTCLEYKCEGVVYNSDKDLNTDKTDNTNVTIQVQGSSQRCCVRGLPGFMNNNLHNIQLNQAVPVWFIDQGNYGPDHGLFRHPNLQPSPYCKDEQSPQDTSIDHCHDTDMVFRHAIEVTCDSRLCRN
ncbi:cartilage intermediate layer protein 1-like [Amphiura filiformis]|uniref:cartilage intermediate layer protein 1-like n=1 Tax=Amphiura filiformis TaxID=82378 RepID=UPI003B2130DA